MRRRGEGHVGRGCCAGCFSPFMCADTECGCHVADGWKCRRCPTGLYIVFPPDSRITDIEAWRTLPDETKSALSDACWQARLAERRTA